MEKQVFGPVINGILSKKSLIDLASKFTTKQKLLGVVMTLRRVIYNSLTNYFGLKIVTREELVKDGDRYHTLHFGSTETIVAEKPLCLDEIPQVIKPLIGKVTFKNPFVSEVTNAQLLGSSAIGLDQGKNIIMETVFPDFDDGTPGFISLPVRTLVRKQVVKTEADELDTVCSLVAKWSKVYGHWFIDCLPRLEGLEQYQEKTGRKPLIVIDSNPTSWQIESLRLLGYGPDDCIEWDRKRVNVKRLVVPSFRRQAVWPEAKACEWLRQRMISNLPPSENAGATFSPRILISRAKAAGRNIINEDEVMEALAPLGFVSYVLEDMSFADEVRLFSQAEMIVGIHGSGLTNMIFSQKKPIVIDLFDSWYTGVFYKIAASLGFEYACLQCQNPLVDLERASGNTNLIVDVAKLKRLINVALLSADRKESNELHYYESRVPESLGLCYPFVGSKQIF
jgi:hypothetical protein